MLGFCILAPLGDAVAKILSTAVPLGQLLFVRFAIQAAVLFPIILATGRPWRMRGRVLKLVFVRTLLHMLGIGAMFTALRYLPLADAVAIAFVMPFFMLLLGRFILHEEVGLRRLCASIVGFIGTLLVIQPSFVSVGWPAFLPLVVAVVFAFFMLITRQIAKETDPICLQAISGLMASAMIIPALIFGAHNNWRELTMIQPDVPTVWLLVIIGLLGTLVHLLMTWALRYAPSTTLAPMQYLEIPFAALIGWLFFGDWPNQLAGVGILITVAAGLYVVFRERATSRAAPPIP